MKHTTMTAAQFCIEQGEAVSAGGGLEILPLRYWKGDLAAYTGKRETIHGAPMFELILLEGHRKGDLIWTSRAPKPAAGKAVMA